MFHVSLLNQSTKGASSKRKLPQLTEEGTIQVAPASILDRRTSQRNGQEVDKILVQCTNLAAEHASLEDLTFIQAQFPQFQSNVNPRD